MRTIASHTPPPESSAMVGRDKEILTKLVPKKTAKGRKRGGEAAKARAGLKKMKALGW